MDVNQLECIQKIEKYEMLRSHKECFHLEGKTGEFQGCARAFCWLIVCIREVDCFAKTLKSDEMGLG